MGCDGGDIERQSLGLLSGHLSALTKIQTGVVTAVRSGCLHKQCSYARFSVWAV
jgi:hypothetical protein